MTQAYSTLRVAPGDAAGEPPDNTEGSDFRAESHLTAWYFDEGLSNG
jgi:hypothetical protein